MRISERSALIFSVLAFGMACLSHYIAGIVFLYLTFAFYVVFVEFDFVHRNNTWKKRNYIGGVLILLFVMMLIYVIEIS
jgi:hypothetical protein